MWYTKIKRFCISLVINLVWLLLTVFVCENLKILKLSVSSFIIKFLIFDKPNRNSDMVVQNFYQCLLQPMLVEHNEEFNLHLLEFGYYYSTIMIIISTLNPLSHVQIFFDSHLYFRQQRSSTNFNLFTHTFTNIPNLFTLTLKYFAFLF